MIDRDRLVKTFCELVSIDSPSGEEEQVAEYLSSKLRALGMEVVRDNYGNLIASDGRDNPIMMSGHMDTVEPGRGIKPSIQGDQVVSDGTTILGGDAKAGVAAILEALQSVTEDGGPRKAVEAVFTREEEPGLVGAHNLDYEMVQSKTAIVFDGEGPPSTITSASPTYVGFDIEVTGRAAHAGVEPENGLSAIRVAAELITRLPQGRLDSETTFNIATLHAGTVRNAVPELATFRGEFRSINIETLDSLKLQLNQVLEEVHDMFPEAKLDHHVHTHFDTYTLPDDDPALIMVKCALGILGLKPTMKTSGGGTDGNIFRQKGIDAVVVGMADHHMHTVREFVTIPDLVDAAHLCETILRND